MKQLYQIGSQFLSIYSVPCSSSLARCIELKYFLSWKVMLNYNLTMKKEGEPNLANNYTKIPSSSSRRWSIHKNPRIVPVSRAFGGKDRHSKVCTVRGLRDRRIRLSVQTAIQLYDLQEKLGVGQPSKVVDWLLDATKNDIDKLPALPMVPVFTHLTHQPLVPSHPIPANPQPHFLSSYPKDLGMNPSKDESKINENGEGKDKWSASNSKEGFGGFVAQLSAQNLFPLGNQSSFTNIPYNPYFHLDHQNMPLSQFGGVYPNFATAQTDDQNQSHNNSLPSILPSNSQLHFAPSNIPTFPSSINNDLRQISHLQHVQHSPLLPTTLNLISSPMNANSQKHQPRENDTAGRPRKDIKES